MIPAYCDGLNLPMGGHACTLTELEERFASNDRRRRLFQSLIDVLKLARKCGFLQALLGGSFPTAKESPGDLDITWFCKPGTDKTTVSRDCIQLMEDSSNEMSFMYIPYDMDSKPEDCSKKLELWASPACWGMDSKTNTPRGVLLIDLTDDDPRLR